MNINPNNQLKFLIYCFRNNKDIYYNEKNQIFKTSGRDISFLNLNELSKEKIEHRIIDFVKRNRDNLDRNLLKEFDSILIAQTTQMKSDLQSIASLSFLLSYFISGPSAVDLQKGLDQLEMVKEVVEKVEAEDQLIKISQQFEQISRLKADGVNIYENKFQFAGKEFSLEEFLKEKKIQLKKMKYSLESYDQTVPALLSIDRSLKLIAPIDPSSTSTKISDLLENIDKDLLDVVASMKQAKAEYPHAVYLEEMSSFKLMQQRNLTNYVNWWFKLNCGLDVIQGMKLNLETTRSEDIESIVFTAIKKTFNPHISEIVKKGFDEMIKIYFSFTNSLENDIQNIEKAGMAQLSDSEDRFEKVFEAMEQAEKVYDQHFATIMDGIPELVNKIVEIRAHQNLNWELLRHEYLEEGICLGASVAYAAACVKNEAPLEGIRLGSQERFIQAHHNLLTKIFPEKMQDLLIEIFKLEKKINQSKVSIQSMLPDASIDWSVQSLQLLMEQKKDNKKLCDEIQILLGYAEEKKSANMQLNEMIKKMLNVPLPTKLLQHLKIDYKIVEENRLDLSEFMLQKLPLLIESCKEQKDAHFIMIMENRMDHLIHNAIQLRSQSQTMTPQKETPMLTEEEVEQRVKKIVGENAPQQVIKSIKAKFLISQDLKSETQAHKSHGRHAVYLSLQPPYVIYDANLPEFKEMKAETIEEFQKVLFSWFTIFPYQTIQSLGQVTASEKNQKNAP
jgi:hypothetical protein